MQNIIIIKKNLLLHTLDVTLYNVYPFVCNIGSETVIIRTQGSFVFFDICICSEFVKHNQMIKRRWKFT